MPFKLIEFCMQFPFSAAANRFCLERQRFQYIGYMLVLTAAIFTLHKSNHGNQ